MYYYRSKEEAQTAGNLIAAANSNTVAFVKPELVENNGWVIVLFPAICDITYLASEAEIRHPDGRRLTPAPVTKRPSFSPVAKAASAHLSSDTPAPKTGATALVHSIANGLVEKGEFKSKSDRQKVIDACVAAGINAGTAGTQYSKWMRLRGL